MKYIKYIFISVVIGLIASGCWRPTVFENDFPTYEVNATIEYYCTLKRKSLYGSGDKISYTLETSVNDSELKINMRMWGSEIVASIIDFALGKGTAERYAELREEFGDFNPNASILYVPEIENPVSNDELFENVCCVTEPANLGHVFYEKICSLSVTSSKDWNAQHPAGALLNDLFEIQFDTMYPYIKRGFTGSWVTGIQKPLNNLAEDDLWLCTNCFRLPSISTSSLPTTSGVHTIFVTLTLDTGEQIEYSTEVTFE